jgi:membrane protein YqaA with SNARE-associated domain
MVLGRSRRLGRERLTLTSVLFVLIILVWGVVLFYASPSEIIAYLGVNNGYLLTFIGGLLGGISILFPFPNYLFVLTFAAGGLNPLLLGVFAAMGLVLGECTSYLFGYVSHSIVYSGTKHPRIHAFVEWLERRNERGIALLLFVVGMLPLPNDLVLVPLGFGRYPFWKVMVPLFVGNLCYYLILAFIGFYGFG